MFKYILSLSFLSLLLTSCVGNEELPTPPVLHKNNSSSSGSLQITVPVKEITNTGGNTVSNTVSNTGGNTGSNNIITAAKSPDIESIQNITTLDDLKKIIPNIDSALGKDHPKFIELQKTQLKLGLQMTKLQDREYFRLIAEQMNILQCKEVWSVEVKQMDKEFKEALSKRMTLNPSIDEDAFKAISEKRNKILKDFQSSKECGDYISSQQTKLDEISASTKKYYTPEVQELQKTIEKLTAEVYASNIQIHTSQVSSGQVNPQSNPEGTGDSSQIKYENY